MNKLQKTLTELTPEHSYRIKFALEPDIDKLSKIINRLETRYDAYDISPLVKTIFQVKPLDFYNLDCGEIWMFDFKSPRGIQPLILQFEIGEITKWSESMIVVRGEFEPLEIESEEDDIDFDDYVPRITDPDYTDAPDINPDEYYGTDYKEKMVQKTIDEYKKDRTPYSEYMAAGFKNRGKQ